MVCLCFVYVCLFIVAQWQTLPILADCCNSTLPYCPPSCFVLYRKSKTRKKKKTNKGYYREMQDGKEKVGKKERKVGDFRHNGLKTMKTRRKSAHTSSRFDTFTQKKS
ncbi:hypothetical protein BKA57DRAFT_462661 [Linnemannia elongata]|nr:hypothetical protein BKA57DRAFT_462661 [Linnemannia elongata]